MNFLEDYKPGMSLCPVGGKVLNGALVSHTVIPGYHFQNLPFRFPFPYGVCEKKRTLSLPCVRMGCVVHPKNPL